MDLNSIQKENEPLLMQYVNKTMPRYYTSRERMHTMFVRKCISPVSLYQTCLGNNKWCVLIKNNYYYKGLWIQFNILMMT
jgi:hypothetical protein